jgi:hypothetical protein
MSAGADRFTGGCLCGAIRYDATAPMFMGLCFCADCRKASGSGFVPFIGFASDNVRFSGKTRTFTSKSAAGTDSVRNSCPVCGGLVFGGIVGTDSFHTVYAGSLDDPTLFVPTMAIFGRSRPGWVAVPPGLTVFDAMPPGPGPA